MQNCEGKGGRRTTVNGKNGSMLWHVCWLWPSVGGFVDEDQHEHRDKEELEEQKTSVVLNGKKWVATLKSLEGRGGSNFPGSGFIKVTENWNEEETPLLPLYPPPLRPLLEAWLVNMCVCKRGMVTPFHVNVQRRGADWKPSSSACDNSKQKDKKKSLFL